MLSVATGAAATVCLCVVLLGDPFFDIAVRPNFKVDMGFGLHHGWAIEGAIGSYDKTRPHSFRFATNLLILTHSLAPRPRMCAAAGCTK